MTDYAKPAVRNAWAETAAPADIADPGNTFASGGWPQGQKPPRQYFNWVLNYVFAAVRYFMQRGISAWDSTETYGVGSLVQASNGAIYRSLIANNNNNDPAVGGNFQVSWDCAKVADAPTNDSSGRIASTSFVFHNYIKQGSNFSAIAGTIANGQVPQSAVTQWQGALAIAGSQVTSAVARANSLLLSGTGNYAAFSWSGQAGQPAWLFGSNDGANVAVWNPANFSVADSARLGGLQPAFGAVANTAALRDGGGYLWAQYFNQASSNNENPSISQVMVTNGADGFLRKASVAALRAALSALTSSNFPGLLSTNGYFTIPTSAGNIIVQYGTCNPSGGSTVVTFPISFPSACRAAVCTSSGIPTQSNIPSKNQFNMTVTNTGGTSDWIAIGY